MDDKARFTLESAIKIIDQISGDPEKGSWKSSVEKQVKAGDQESLKETLITMQLIMNSSEGVEQAVSKILVGENIFTPSLTTRGWQFWKHPILEKKDCESVGTAFIRYSQTKVKLCHAVVNSVNTYQDGDKINSSLMAMASYLDNAIYWRRQLSNDLRAILNK